MDLIFSESFYPITFRKDDAMKLAEYLEERKSVELIGMKRVGIHAFLRFFLSQKEVRQTYLSRNGKNFFIFVDLNDLIERELFSFWRLTLKRIVDAVEASELSDEVKTKVGNIFLTCIQSGDFFLTYDGVREMLVLLAKDVFPTLFLSRFDRLKDVVSPEFFDNLESLKDVTNQKLSYVLTSFRDLDTITSSAFARKSLSTFSSVAYVKPANAKDARVLLHTLMSAYKEKLPDAIIEALITLGGGHAQYLQLATIVVYENSKKIKTIDAENCLSLVVKDERVSLLSEELWESLSVDEQSVLRKIVTGKLLVAAEKERARYLWDTGFIISDGKVSRIFSPLLEAYVLSQQEEKESGNVELSKKEYSLFSLLKERVNDICEREVIVERVWPEYKTYGVSDWTIDRLVARVRIKLRKQKSTFEIITIRTRGYKLASTK